MLEQHIWLGLGHEPEEKEEIFYPDHIALVISVVSSPLVCCLLPICFNFLICLIYHLLCLLQARKVLTKGTDQDAEMDAVAGTEAVALAEELQEEDLGAEDEVGSFFPEPLHTKEWPYLTCEYGP